MTRSQNSRRGRKHCALSQRREWVQECKQKRDKKLRESQRAEEKK